MENCHRFNQNDKDQSGHVLCIIAMHVKSALRSILFIVPLVRNQIHAMSLTPNTSYRIFSCNANSVGKESIEKH